MSEHLFVFGGDDEEMTASDGLKESANESHSTTLEESVDGLKVHEEAF